MYLEIIRAIAPKMSIVENDDLKLKLLIKKRLTKKEITILEMEELINKFSSRMAIIEKIGEYKSENNVTILQLERWEKILANRTFLAEKVGLSDDFIKKMLEIIHQESIRIQTKVMNK